MVCIRDANHDGKHRGVSVPGRKEPPTIWWDPAELPLLGGEEETQ